jgi:hypothetical protein
MYYEFLKKEERVKNKENKIFFCFDNFNQLFYIKSSTIISKDIILIEIDLLLLTIHFEQSHKRS